MYSILYWRETVENDPANIRGVCMVDILRVEHVAQADIVLYRIDIVDGSMIGELARSSIGKHSNTMQRSVDNSQLWYVSNIKTLLKSLSLSIVRSIQ